MALPNYYQQQMFQPNLQNPFDFSRQSYQAAPPQQTQSGNQQLTFVNGLDGARSFPVPTNSSVILMDNNDNSFFIKTTDSAGLFTLRKFGFAEVNLEPAKVEADKQTGDDIKRLTSRLDALLDALSNQSKENNNERTQTASKQRKQPVTDEQ